jgi:tetratricopeptide (TPR) repeat protein
MAGRIPDELEASDQGPPDDAERAELLALEADLLLDLGRREEAAEAARRALELDPDSEAAAEVLDRLS